MSYGVDQGSEAVVALGEVTDPTASARLVELCGRAERVESFEGHARSGEVRAHEFAGAPLPWAPRGVASA